MVIASVAAVDPSVANGRSIANCTTWSSMEQAAAPTMPNASPSATAGKRHGIGEHSAQTPPAITHEQVNGGDPEDRQCSGGGRKQHGYGEPETWRACGQDWRRKPFMGCRESSTRVDHCRSGTPPGHARPGVPGGRGFPEWPEPSRVPPLPHRCSYMRVKMSRNTKNVTCARSTCQMIPKSRKQPSEAKRRADPRAEPRTLDRAELRN